MIESTIGKSSISEEKYREMLQQLYKKALPDVTKMVKKLGGTWDDAKDVFQDAVVIMFRKIKENNFDMSIEPERFVFHVSRNLWLNKLKRDKKQQNIDDVPEFGDQTKDVIQVMDLKEREQSIRDVLKQLGERCAELLKSLIFDDLDYAEVAEKMQMASTDVVKTTKNRCKTKLMDLLNLNPELKKKLGVKHV